MTPGKAKKRIKMMGLKINHVANVIGVDQSTLSFYLNEKRDLNDNVKEKLKNYLKF